MDIENKYGTLATQKGLLELLKEFHRFCVQNGVAYSLAAGSLLGAVRHNGFIPWDDDLDIYVDRNNYNKIIQLLANHETLVTVLYGKELLWIDMVRMKADIDRDGHLPTLDLLVFDHAPDGQIKKKFKLLCIICLQGMMKLSPNFKKGSMFYRMGTFVSYCLGLLFPHKLKKKMYRRFSQIGNNTPSKSIANYNGPFDTVRKEYPGNMLDITISHVFEDTEAYIMKDWDTCLTLTFGDYMTPPHETERRPQHGG